MKRDFTFDVSNTGQLSGRAKLAIDDFIRSLAGKVITIRIAPREKRRSSNQNAYYWGVVVPPITAALREAGNDVDDDDAHEYLKTHVGKLRRVIVIGEDIKRIPGSTKRLTTQEMEIYLEKVRAWAAEQGVVIPLPNESLPE